MAQQFNFDNNEEEEDAEESKEVRICDSCSVEPLVACMAPCMLDSFPLARSMWI